MVRHLRFKDAALSLATPSIIGDGNVLLDILVNNDTPVEVPVLMSQELQKER